MLACETAPGCSAFAYSPQDRACFLKGCPSNFTMPPPPSATAPSPPSPPAPPAPPCTNPIPSLCPVVNATYYSYYHKTRYQDACTFVAGNPNLSFEPSPFGQSAKMKPVFAPGAVISPETAAGNGASSLGLPPPVTVQGPDTPVPGERSFNSLPTRAASPTATPGGGAISTSGR
ncbi:hypothetical protein ABBQ32_005845 [Trebouxia sp. C0010 RCD-2024]